MIWQFMATGGISIWSSGTLPDLFIFWNSTNLFYLFSLSIFGLLYFTVFNQNSYFPCSGREAVFLLISLLCSDQLLYLKIGQQNEDRGDKLEHNEAAVKVALGTGCHLHPSATQGSLPHLASQMGQPCIHLWNTVSLIADC